MMLATAPKIINMTPIAPVNLAIFFIGYFLIKDSSEILVADIIDIVHSYPNGFVDSNFDLEFKLGDDYASKIYFNKEFPKLSDDEYLSLVAMLIAPNTYHVINSNEKNRYV